MANALKQQYRNPESQNENPKYPRAIPFIILNEFCERFNYYGMRAILVLYMLQKLSFSEDLSTMVFHLFTFFVYFFCLVGAIIADSFIGKFKTILSFSTIYAIGSAVVTFGAMSKGLPGAEMLFIGLALIAIGSGGIKPCVVAFGAEQFQIPQQANHLVKYFSMFYFAINAGSFLSTIVTPILREDVKCFNSNDCYPAAFGLPTVLMITSILLFICGSAFYKIVPSGGNMLTKVCSCIGNAISTKRRENKTKPRDHWLDFAEEKHGKLLVMETKILLNVLVLFTPLPLFWALFEQQGSRWTFQATKMDGDVGFYVVKPDQMQILNPLMILAFIPLAEYGLYPLLKFLGIRRPLQKMAIGGTLAGVSFLISAAVQNWIDIAEPGSVSIFWQVPQYAVMTLGEVMFSVTGLEFSFTQAPKSMKSVITACWLLTNAFGNIFVFIIVSTGLMKIQVLEFLLFAILMFVDMIVFMLLAKRYKPIPLEKLDEVGAEEK